MYLFNFALPSLTLPTNPRLPLFTELSEEATLCVCVYVPLSVK